jgi:Spy/CpxP family protein refolding chaperone
MKKLILAAMATVMVAGSAYGATFEGAPMTLRGAVLKTLIRLQLTDAQKHEIALVLKHHQTDFQPVVNAMQAARANLRKALGAAHPDRDTVLSAYRRVADAGEQLVMLFVDLIPQLREILTVKQQQIFDNGQVFLNQAMAQRVRHRRSLLKEWIALYAE